MLQAGVQARKCLHKSFCEQMMILRVVAPPRARPPHPERNHPPPPLCRRTPPLGSKNHGPGAIAIWARIVAAFHSGWRVFQGTSPVKGPLAGTPAHRCGPRFGPHDPEHVLERRRDQSRSLRALLKTTRSRFDLGLDTDGPGHAQVPGRSPRPTGVSGLAAGEKCSEGLPCPHSFNMCVSTSPPLAGTW